MEENKNSSGSLIGSIIVVLILIIGAIYLFSSQVSAPASEMEAENAGGTMLEDNAGDATGAVVQTDVSLDAEAQEIAQDAASLEAELAELNQAAGL